MSIWFPRKRCLVYNSLQTVTPILVWFFIDIPTKITNTLENTQLIFYDFIYNRFHEHLSRQNFLGISVCHTKLSLLLLYVIDHKYHASDFEMDVHEFSTCWNIIWRTMFSLQHISYQIRIAFWNSKMTSKIYFKSFSFY